MLGPNEEEIAPLTNIEPVNLTMFVDGLKVNSGSPSNTPALLNWIWVSWPPGIPPPPVPPPPATFLNKPASTILFSPVFVKSDVSPFKTK